MLFTAAGTVRSKRWSLVLAPLALVAAACSSGEPTTISVAPAVDDAPTTAPNADTATPTATVEAQAPSAIDQDFLFEQTAGVNVPEGQGAFMVAVIDADGGALHASEGTDLDGNSPTPSDPFRVGSITKVFTSLVTLTLVDEGLVDLDARVTEYVADVGVPDGVAVRDLLQHTSGIPNYTDSPLFFPTVQSVPGRVWAPSEVVELVEDREALFEPGARFSYSNTNYVILGMLIEEVTGEPFPEVLRTRIIDPLAMSNTYLAGAEEGPAPFGAFASLAGSPEPIRFDYTSIATSAWTAGAVVSSAEDLHVLLGAVFDGRVISADSLAEMVGNDEYGLGIEVWGSPEGLFGHGGGIPGYSTLVVHAPDTGRTAFWVVTGEIDFSPAVAGIAQRLVEDR